MPKKLLLADDSITIQKVIAITFANEDYTITTVSNGDEAIQKAQELNPDLIMADVVMPGKDGYEVCEIVKKDPQLKDIPVLLLTGTFETFDEQRSIQVGANGYITKPFESQTLIDKVNQLISEQKKPAAPPPRPAAPPPRPAAPPPRPAAPPPRPAAPPPRPAAPPPRPAAPPPRPAAPPPVEAKPAAEEHLEDFEVLEAKPEEGVLTEPSLEVPAAEAPSEEEWNMEEFEELVDSSEMFKAEESLEKPDWKSISPSEEEVEEDLWGEELAEGVPLEGETSPEIAEEISEINSAEKLTEAVPISTAPPEEVSAVTEPESTEGEELYTEFDEETISGEEVGAEKGIGLETEVPLENATDVSPSYEEAQEVSEFEAPEQYREEIPGADLTTIEKVVRGALPELADKIIKELVRETVEKIVWEVVPDLAETLIQEEIKKFQDKK